MLKVLSDFIFFCGGRGVGWWVGGEGGGLTSNCISVCSVTRHRGIAEIKISVL